MRHRRAAAPRSSLRSRTLSQKSRKAGPSRQASLTSQAGPSTHPARSLAPSPQPFDLPVIPSSDGAEGVQAARHANGGAEPSGSDDLAEGASEGSVEVDSYWTDGDFAFVSSDNREFRVSSSALSKQSETCAGLVRQASRLTGENYMRIHFNESSQHIGLFLTALFSSKTPWDLSLSVTDVVQLMLFGKHFDCEELLDRLVPILAAHGKDKKTNSYEVFRGGAVAERWDLCVLALTAHPTKWRWSRGRAEESPIDLALGCVHGESFLDPLALPYHWYMQLPKKALWALTRATTEVASSDGGGKKPSWRQRAHRFRELIRMIEERDGEWPKYAEMTR